MDDYRLFANSQTEAYKHLAILANALFKNPGLTLQQEKTRIITTEDFLQNFSISVESQELKNLSEKFSELIRSFEHNDPYGYIEYEHLDPEDQAFIDSLNLEDLLYEQLANTEIDQRMVQVPTQKVGTIRLFAVRGGNSRRH